MHNTTQSNPKTSEFIPKLIKLTSQIMNQTQYFNLNFNSSIKVEIAGYIILYAHLSTTCHIPEANWNKQVIQPSPSLYKLTAVGL